MYRQDIIDTATEAQRFVELAAQLLRGAPVAENLNLLMPFAQEFQEQSRFLTHKLNRLWQNDRAAVQALIEADRAEKANAAAVAAEAGLQAPTEPEQKVLLVDGEEA